jgi:hypothetical protein
MEAAFSKLEELEQNPSEIAKMGQNSRKLAETLFSKELAINRLLEVIQPKSKLTPGGEVGIRTA